MENEGKGLGEASIKSQKDQLKRMQSQSTSARAYVGRCKDAGTESMFGIDYIAC